MHKIQFADKTFEAKVKVRVKRALKLSLESIYLLSESLKIVCRS